MDTIWSRVKQNSQYQWGEVHTWASHLKHLKSIEFDADKTLEKPDLIRFFREGCQPSVKAQMEQRERELNSWDALVGESDR